MAQLKDLIVSGTARILNKLYASEFVGKLTGNADTATSATKATQDESGNNIKSSYASSIGISDHTITLKNKNGESLGSVTVPDNNSWRPLGTGANDACAGNDSRLSNARAANGSGYVSELVGVQSNNTPYSYTEGNIIRAVWNTKSDNRWYLKAGDYGCRVSCADNADSVSWSNVSGKPSSMPANGGNASTVNGHTVNSDVPANAKFTDTVYTHPSHSQKTSGFYKFAVDALGHVSSTTAVTKSDITSLGIASNSVATTTSNGLMSKDMVTKLNGIATNANRIYIKSLTLGSMTLQGNWDGDAPQLIAVSDGSGFPLCIIPRSSGSADVCWIDCYIDSNNRTKVRLKNTTSSTKTFSPSVFLIYRA